MQVSARRRASAGGWTLPELLAAVVIVGILAVIAIPAYRSLVKSSRFAEPARTLQSIRVAQERYHQANSKYAHLSASHCLAGSLTNCYPTTTPGAKLVGWGGPCAGCGGTVDWPELDLRLDGPVMFGYGVMAGAPGVAPAGPITMRLKQGPVTVSFNAAPGYNTMDWFVMTATGDPDGSGAYCTVLGSSFTTELTTEVDCQ